MSDKCRYLQTQTMLSSVRGCRLSAKNWELRIHKMVKVSLSALMKNFSLLSFTTGCGPGEAGTRSPCPGEEEGHRGGLHSRLDGVCSRSGAQQHPALCRQSSFPPARKLPQTKTRWVVLHFGIPSVSRVTPKVKDQRPRSKVMRLKEMSCSLEARAFLLDILFLIN